MTYTPFKNSASRLSCSVNKARFSGPSSSRFPLFIQLRSLRVTLFCFFAASSSG